ncbi:MAG: class I SAM-dependent methyltransferase [Acidobacteriota bacterium]|nr:class I SAM-dependent methyltransferase [Acidobacteriota bacterium]
MERPHQPDGSGSAGGLRLSESEATAQAFYDRWIGGTGLRSRLGRTVFSLSGTVYSGPFIQAAALRPEDRVMEIGSGLGEILTASQRRIGAEQPYFGIDLSYQMVRRARRGLESRRPSLHFLVASALQMPFRRQCFDVVLLSHVVKYLTDPQLRQVLAQVKALLRPGGRLVLWEFRPYAWGPINRIILRGSGSHKLRSAAELVALLQEQGFRNLQPFRVHTPWPPFRNLAYRAQAG